MDIAGKEYGKQPESKKVAKDEFSLSFARSAAGEEKYISENNIKPSGERARGKWLSPALGAAKRKSPFSLRLHP